MTVPKDVTIEELAKSVTAVSIQNRTYDARHRTYTIILEPEFGYDPGLKDMRYQITFTDCLCVYEYGTILTSDRPATFLGVFWEWGKRTPFWLTHLKQGEAKTLQAKAASNNADIEVYTFGGIGSDDVIILSGNTRLKAL